MKIKCEYCGSMIEDTAAKCPNCGASNTNVKRMTITTPQTIEQLKDWYKARNLPPYETTRFFIGENHKGPKAFGIYQEGNEFIVYKNKADGSRAVRYRGTDEAYAVNELYLKLKSEILNQKAHQGGTRSSVGKAGEAGGVFVLFLTIFSFIAARIAQVGIFKAICFIVVFSIIYSLVSKFIIRRVAARNNEAESEFDFRHPKLSKWLIKNPLEMIAMGRATAVMVVTLLILCILIGTIYNKPHYYRWGNDTYVSYHNDWYYYDYYDYTPIGKEYLPVELQNHPADYEYSWEETSEWDSRVSRFESSDTYKDNYATDWSSDSDYDWDSGSDWDSGGTDWDSDW